jgi:hypothetical protein
VDPSGLKCEDPKCCCCPTGLTPGEKKGFELTVGGEKGWRNEFIIKAGIIYVDGKGKQGDCNLEWHEKTNRLTTEHKKAKCEVDKWCKMPPDLLTKTILKDWIKADKKCPGDPQEIELKDTPAAQYEDGDRPARKLCIFVRLRPADACKEICDDVDFKMYAFKYVAREGDAYLNWRFGKPLELPSGDDSKVKYCDPWPDGAEGKKE